MNTDIMIDLETLDVLPSATILSIGAVKFDPFGDDVNEKKCEKFYVRVDVDSCDRIGATVSQATLDWWANQSQAAQDEAFDPANRVSIEEAMTQLYKFCWGGKRVWSHGAGFDVTILEWYFRKIGKAIPWSFWVLLEDAAGFVNRDFEFELAPENQVMGPLRKDRLGHGAAGTRPSG